MMSKLFSPKDFLDTQKWLNSYSDSDILLERAIDLHSRFQEYMVPIVTISGRSAGDVVRVFERINTIGTPLSSVDFMRAVTWSEDFDLNSELEKVSTPLTSRGFKLPPETIVKVLAVSMGKDPSSESMLELRKSNSSDLHTGITCTINALNKTIDFLQFNFKIQSYQFIPYEGQVLAVTKLFLMCPNPSNAQLNVLRRWFWTVSFNEELRGKPDHFVFRMLRRIESLARPQTSVM